MNQHLTAFLSMAAVRDSNLTQLGLMSLAAVITWYAIGLAPERWRHMLKYFYLAGGVLAYLVTFLVQLKSV